MAAELKPIHVDCPACGASIRLPARLVLDGGNEATKADVLVDLDPAREHAREHAGGPLGGDGGSPVLEAALGHFGLPW